MKVYVAGSRAEAHRARHFMERLVTRGVTVTLDWTNEPASDRLLSTAQRKHIAQLTQRKIDECDLFVWLVPTREALSWGSAFEAGYAFGTLKHTMACGPAVFETAMVEHFNAVLASDLDGFDYVLQSAKEYEECSTAPRQQTRPKSVPPSAAYERELQLAIERNADPAEIEHLETLMREGA